MLYFQYKHRKVKTVVYYCALFLCLCSSYSWSINPKKEWLRKYTDHFRSGGLYVVKNRKSYCSIPETFLADKNGKILSSSYRDIGEFSCGLAEIVHSEDYNNEFGNHGFINTEGKVIIKPIYASVGKFSKNGIAWAIKFENNRYNLYYIDINGEEVIEIKIPKWCKEFRKKNQFTVYPCGYESQEQIQWNVEGTLLFLSPILNAYIEGEIKKSKRALILSNKGYYGMIDSEEILRTPIFMDEINTDNHFSGEGLYRCRYNNLYGFISAETGEISIECIYENVLRPSLNRIWLKDGGKWFCIDKDKNVVIAKKYDFVVPFSQDGIAGVGFKGKYGYIDIRGNVITPLIYDMTFSFVNNWGLVKKQGKYGVVNKEGKIVIDAIYDSIVILDKKNFIIKQYGISWKIDKDGKTMIKSISSTLIVTLILISLLVFLFINFK